MRKFSKALFIVTYIFFLFFFLWHIWLGSLLNEFMPLGPIYTDVAKRIESPDGTKTALLIRRNGFDLDFAVKIKEGLKTRTLRWWGGFTPNLKADWNEQIVWSDDSNLIVLTVQEPPYKYTYTDKHGNTTEYFEQNEKYMWAYDFKTEKEYRDKDIIISVLNSRNKKDEHTEGNIPSLEPPKALNDEWSKWLVGEWQGTAKSDFGEHKDWAKGDCRLNIELALNGQFLVRKGQSRVTGLSYEYIKQLKGQHLSDSDIEKMRKSTFESIEVYTIDPKTGEVVGYLFDSLRCVAKGTGKREGNKEIMNWVWSVQGQGSSVRVTEKVDNDKFITTEKYKMPDGGIMEDKAEMIRSKKGRSDSDSGMDLQNPEQLVSYLEKEGRNWMVTQRDAHWAKGRPLESDIRSVIGPFFQNDTLDSVRICEVPQIENPPFYKELERQGIPMSLSFSDMAGITFDDTVLINPSKIDAKKRTSLVFHECVHVAQFRFLKPDGFVREYVKGWVNNEFDYYKIPLEIQAYQLQQRFDANSQSTFSVEAEVAQKWK